VVDDGDDEVEEGYLAEDKLLFKFWRNSLLLVLGSYINVYTANIILVKHKSMNCWLL
jgi:hypothetical protein